MYNILKQVALTQGISGKERKVAEKISELVAPYCDETRIDAMGNLIALKRGSSKNAKKVMLCAHMDEIGFIVNFIEKSGFIRVAPVGGISYVACAYGEVVSDKGTHGVLVPNSGTKAEDFKPDNFYIDIGADSDTQAKKKVSIGDVFNLKSNVSRLCGQRVVGRPLDDRIGCAVVVEIARRIAELGSENDIYYVFSVQEEVGCRGSKTAAFAIQPDVSLTYDVTGTGDTAGSKPMAVKLGGGAAIKIKDASVICDVQLVDKLYELAKDKKIKHQLEILTYGGTDTSSIQMSGSGCPAGALSIPSRYIHSGVEMIDMKDAAACVDLTVEFIKTL